MRGRKIKKYICKEKNVKLIYVASGSKMDRKSTQVDLYLMPCDCCERVREDKGKFSTLHMKETKVLINVKIKVNVTMI